MKSRDRNLGMDRRITRRDLLHGVGALATTSLVPGKSLADEVLALESGGEGAAGFDPARDIDGITVNRWAHGYSYSYDWLEEPYYADWDDERYPHVQARKPFGRITIANSDAGASAMLESAVEQAYRAVIELG